MTTRGKLMQGNIKLMQFLCMWPGKDQVETKRVRILKDILWSINLYLGSLTPLADFLIQLSGQYDDILDISENIAAVGGVFGAVYMGICFIQNRKRLMKLIDDLEVFEQFGSAERMLETEVRAAFLTKIFVTYGILGVIFYMAVPFIDLDSCKEKRSHYKYYKEMPCELITRFRVPFKYEDKQWAVNLAVMWQFIICLNATVLTLSITTFVVSLLMQIIAQLQELRLHIRMNKPVRDCIIFHITIIEFSSRMSEAFSSTMLMYITLTSIQISVLGFEVIMVNSFTFSIRYALHLLGWLILLYLVCSYGQKIIDESKEVGWEAYLSPWYEKTIAEQKDLKMMIIRSQKPLNLTAASLGTLSLQAFLSVLSTAYSYFTLLLNIKKK